MSHDQGTARLLLCRFSFDGHDRGVLSLMDRCKQAGMEVIYIHFNDPAEISKVALEEDVDIIGVTSSIGQHLYVASRMLESLREKQMSTPVVFGGVIPTVDEPRLQELGVKKVFGPGSTPGEAVAFLSELAARKDA